MIFLENYVSVEPRLKKKSEVNESLPQGSLWETIFERFQLFKRKLPVVKGKSLHRYYFHFSFEGCISVLHESCLIKGYTPHIFSFFVFKTKLDEIVHKLRMREIVLRKRIWINLTFTDLIFLGKLTKALDDLSFAFEVSQPSESLKQ